jgi:hypothetical protein
LQKKKLYIRISNVYVFDHETMIVTEHFKYNFETLLRVISE